MMKSFFDGHPLTSSEQAGAERRWLVATGKPVYQIVLPLQLSRGLAAVTFYKHSSFSWNDYIFARTFPGGREMTTMAVGCGRSSCQRRKWPWNKVMAKRQVMAQPLRSPRGLPGAPERHFVSGHDTRTSI